MSQQTIFTNQLNESVSSVNFPLHPGLINQNKVNNPVEYHSPTTTSSHVSSYDHFTIHQNNTNNNISQNSELKAIIKDANIPDLQTELLIYDKLKHKTSRDLLDDSYVYKQLEIDLDGVKIGSIFRFHKALMIRRDKSKAKHTITIQNTITPKTKRNINMKDNDGDHD